MNRIDIFDLDYTLLDADKLKRNCLAAFFDIDEEEFMKNYQENFKDQKINYNIEKHMQGLGWSQEKIVEKMKEFDVWLKQEISRYLLPGAERLLKRFKEIGDKMVLVSFGDKEFQKQKISALTIDGASAEDFFDEIIISDNNKHELEELKCLRGKNILLVNDKVKELVELSEILGDRCETFLIDGPYARSPEYNLPVNNLKDLEEKFFPEEKKEIAKELNLK
ncbi:MAG: HAD hydrolase-like protein [bacterium]|nr:HAD hydrolase-like protein [bacterium]